MAEKEKKSPISRIWEIGKSGHSGIIVATIIAVIGILAGIIPYIMAGRIASAMIYGIGDKNFYIICGLTALGGYLTKTILYNISLSISHAATFKILAQIREKIIEKLPKLPLGTVVDMSTSRLKTIFVDKVDAIEPTLAHLFPEMTSNILGPITVFVYLMIVDWRMGLLSIVPVAAGILCMVFVLRGYKEDFEGSVKVNGRMTKTIVEYISGIKVIKTFNQGDKSYEKYARDINANANYFYRWMKRAQLGISIAYAVAPTTLITILPVGWIFYLNGSLSMSKFLLTIILSICIVEPLIKAMSFQDNLATMGSNMGMIDEILEAKEQNHTDSGKEINSYDISVEDISFGYKPDKKNIENVSMYIPQGAYIALVGPSGSGKSTIAKLISSYWDIDSGTIRIGGVDTREIGLTKIYDMISFVSQDNFLFNESVMENIRMGRTTAGDEEVIAAAKLAQAHEFIEAMPEGYKTNVGSGGSHLSGGERQRISIARAILKDAPIVVLDEATAYIDPENEALVQRGIASLVKNKTLIVIAHRLATIKGADMIYLVENGRIKDRGKHEELLVKCPLYQEMWERYMKGVESNATGL